MTAKDKAIKLVLKFKDYSWMSYVEGSEKSSLEESAKKCAVISVNETIEALKVTIGHCTLSSLDHHECMSDIKYWREVVKEIDNL